MFMWLDDVRNPTAYGIVGVDKWVKTVQEAIDYVTSNNVTRMSLDHDLGACEKCFGNMTTAEWMEKHQGMSMPNCPHFGTGYDFVCWLEQHPQYWPENKPTVHSANPVGRARMQRVIDLHYAKENQ